MTEEEQRRQRIIEALERFDRDKAKKRELAKRQMRSKFYSPRRKK